MGMPWPISVKSKARNSEWTWTWNDQILLRLWYYWSRVCHWRCALEGTKSDILPYIMCIPNWWGIFAFAFQCWMTSNWYGSTWVNWTEGARMHCTSISMWCNAHFTKERMVKNKPVFWTVLDPPFWGSGWRSLATLSREPIRPNYDGCEWAKGLWLVEGWRLFNAMDRDNILHIKVR